MNDSSAATESTGVVPIASRSERAVSTAPSAFVVRTTRSAARAASSFVAPSTPSSAAAACGALGIARADHDVVAGLRGAGRRAPCRSCRFLRRARSSRRGLHAASRVVSASRRAASRSVISVSVTTRSTCTDRRSAGRIGAVDHERVEQALVTLCHMRRRRPADEPLHHTVERASHGAPADQRADGDARARCAPRARRGCRGRRGSGGSRRTGCSGRSRSRRPQRSPRGRRAPGAPRRRRRRRARRPRPRAPRATNHSWNANVPAGVTRCVRSAVVGRRQEPGREPAALGEPRRHGRERLARAERLRADEMEAEVEVAEHEPALAAPGPRRLERLPRLPGPPPAALGVVQARRGRRGRESRSGETCRPSTSRSSPTLPITVSSPGASTSWSPAASLAPPTPPERQNDLHARDRRQRAHACAAPPRGPIALEIGERVDVVARFGGRARRGRGRARPRAPGTAAALPGP